MQEAIQEENVGENVRNWSLGVDCKQGVVVKRKIAACMHKEPDNNDLFNFISSVYLPLPHW
jgi:hypothetical protein